ncbi:hypothetical protein OA07_15820 [Aphanizomenon flos-aquae 2012/KM1/D3]|nr:hypothetical protein OA07_15820 [Aphanizomenon flos-aquae 2012/KM1/D3]
MIIPPFEKIGLLNLFLTSLLGIIEESFVYQKRDLFIQLISLLVDIKKTKLRGCLKSDIP